MFKNKKIINWLFVIFSKFFAYLGVLYVLLVIFLAYLIAIKFPAMQKTIVQALCQPYAVTILLFILLVSWLTERNAKSFWEELKKHKRIKA